MSETELKRDIAALQREVANLKSQIGKSSIRIPMDAGIPRIYRIQRDMMGWYFPAQYSAKLQKAKKLAHQEDRWPWQDTGEFLNVYHLLEFAGVDPMPGGDFALCKNDLTIGWRVKGGSGIYVMSLMPAIRIAKMTSETGGNIYIADADRGLYRESQYAEWGNNIGFSYEGIASAAKIPPLEVGDMVSVFWRCGHWYILHKFTGVVTNGTLSVENGLLQGFGFKFCFE